MSNDSASTEESTVTNIAIADTTEDIETTEPTSMTPILTKEQLVDKTFADLEDTYIDCPRCCRKHVVAAKQSPHICRDCEKADNNRVSYYRNHQADWLDVCKASGLEPWEQQPGETQWEFSIWCAYRDAYPGKKPNYVDVARQLNASHAAVKKVAMRWTFAARLQLWMKHVSDITLAQRHTEILTMNKTHIDMANKINAKLMLAIDQIEPVGMKPGDIASLAKVAADLERKAQIDTMAQEQALQDISVDNGNPELKKSPTKKEDLTDVIKILMAAGVLGDVAKAGIKTTKEVVLVNKEGSAATIQTDE
jgi:hypothetical protein